MHPLAVPLAYFALYATIAALSIPGAAALTLVGGALFGVVLGTALVSFTSAIGQRLRSGRAPRCSATGCSNVLQIACSRSTKASSGTARSTSPTLRLIVVFPFWLVNLLMGLTRLRVWTFYWVSQLACCPARWSTSLPAASSASFGSRRASSSTLTLLAIFPLIARWVAQRLKSRRVYARWSAARPAQFDYDLIVIGGGWGGIVSALMGAGWGAGGARSRSTGWAATA